MNIDELKSKIKELEELERIERNKRDKEQAERDNAERQHYCKPANLESWSLHNFDCLIHPDVVKLHIGYIVPRTKENCGMSYWFSLSQKKIIGRVGGGYITIYSDCPYLCAELFKPITSDNKYAYKTDERQNQAIADYISTL